MKVAVCIASHDRQQPLAVVLRCLPKDWHVVLVLTKGEDAKPYLKRPNTHVHFFANQPLGRKWQYAVDRARELKPDFVVITGSDDPIMSSTAAMVKLMEGHDAMGLRSFIAYDGKDHYRCTYKMHVRMPIGGGRVYRASLLDRFRWQLFDITRDKWLDERGWMNAVRHGAKCKVADTLPGFDLVALKGPWPCKNSLDKYKRGRNLDVAPMPAPKGAVPYSW